MSKLQLEHLPDDWGAEWLRERETIVINPDGSNSVHRVQVIECRRDDHEYFEQTDLGDAMQYKHEPLAVWGAGVTKVGRMKDVAANWRHEKGFAEAKGIEEPDLHKLLLETADEQWKARNHTSTFGPHLKRER